MLPQSVVGAEQELKMKEPVVTNKGLIFDGMLFNTPIAKCRYIGTVTAKRRQWLKDHPGEWRTVESIPQEATPFADAQALERETTSPPSCPTPQKVREESSASHSSGVLIEHSQSADSSATAGENTADPSQIAKIALEIAGRAYVSAARLANMLCISERTLSRWCADGSGPPHVKIQGVYFEMDKIQNWAASRGISISGLKETA
jgi:hypothetical protein